MPRREASESMMAIIDHATFSHLTTTADRIRLVHGGGPTEFARAHIPGSVTFPRTIDVLRTLQVSDRIVIYGRDGDCPACRRLYDVLIDNRYTHVDWYRAGLRDWVDAGNPVEGRDAP